MRKHEPHTIIIFFFSIYARTHKHIENEILKSEKNVKLSCHMQFSSHYILRYYYLFFFILSVLFIFMFSHYFSSLSQFAIHIFFSSRIFVALFFLSYFSVVPHKISTNIKDETNANADRKKLCNISIGIDRWCNKFEIEMKKKINLFAGMWRRLWWWRRGLCGCFECVIMFQVL